jgi:hypothetical protein
MKLRPFRSLLRRAHRSLLLVAPPRPVKGDVNVGCFIFPGWHNPSWWRSVAEGSNRRPLLGYYDDTLPSVSDWHIRWAVEHGISFFAFNWYWNKGEKRLAMPLESGFLKARHRNLMKFCVHWCPEFGIEKADFWLNGMDLSQSVLIDMVRYCSAQYFVLSNYLRIGDRPVFMMFKPMDVVCANGGAAGFRETLLEMNRVMHAAGLNDLFLVAVSQDAEGLEAQALKDAGFDALTAYSYAFKVSPRYDAYTCGMSAPYEDMVEQYEVAWKTIRATAALPYIVPVSPGWDDRPWRGFEALWRTGPTPEKFQGMLRRSLKHIDPELKMVIIEAWNEWGEGSFVEPSQASGFDYLEAIRDVYFGPVKSHIDLRPRSGEVRSSSIFTAEERQILELNEGANEVYLSERLAGCSVEIDPQFVVEIVASKDFNECGIHFCTFLEMDSPTIVDGFLRTYIRGVDPGISISSLAISALDVDYIQIRLRVDTRCGQYAQLFWVNDLCQDGYSEYTSEYFKLLLDGGFHVYSLSLKDNPRWRSIVRAIRIDLHGPSGCAVDIEWIRFVKGEVESLIPSDTTTITDNVGDIYDGILEGWRFNEAGDAKGWGVFHLCKPEVIGGELKTIVTGREPIIARHVRIPTSSVTAISFRLRIGVQDSNGLQSGAVLWKYSGAGFGVMAESFGSQGQPFDLVADGQYHDYHVPMVFDPDRKEITGVAIDLWRGGIQIGTAVAIEWIRLMCEFMPTLREPNAEMRIIQPDDVDMAICAGNVDAIVQDEWGRLCVNGWAGFHDTGEPAEDVWVLIGNRALGFWPKEWFLERPDVALALRQPSLLLTGFSIYLRENPEVSSLRVLARRADGQLFEISVMTQ